MKYMLLYWVDEAGEVTEEESAATMTAVGSWIEKMKERGVLRDGGPLCSVRQSRIVRVRDEELLVSDGPFAETKEQVGGYDVIECADLDEATQIAATHPLARAASVEIRPFWVAD